MNTLNAVDSLRKISESIKGDFIENQNGGFLTFKSSFGKGNAKAFKLFLGLEVITFNLTSFKEIVLKDLYKNQDCLHFIFCTEGILEYKFEMQKKPQYINRLQNVIIGSSKHKINTITISKNLKVKFSIISIIDYTQTPINLTNKSQLSNLLSKAMQHIKGDKEYAYFGEISSAASPYVETLINTNISGLSNRLISEAAVFKILSYQYSNYGKNIKGLANRNPLSKTDTIKIIQLSEYISQNLHENISVKMLSKTIGINEKKIQKGFRFFFDETVNKFIINLRILKAKDLLETTDYSISEIVYKIGLNSRSYFSKIFYKKYGLLPKEYRKHHHLTNPTFQISYTSKANTDINKEDLEDILLVAKKKNLALNITGCLIYSENAFYQILEGPKTEVLNLIEKIKKDSRNEKLEIIFEGVKSGRIFSEWNMALIQDLYKTINNNNFEIVPPDFLAISNIKNPVANKYMWEKARNHLIINQEKVDK